MKNLIENNEYQKIDKALSTLNFSDVNIPIFEKTDFITKTKSPYIYTLKQRRLTSYILSIPLAISAFTTLWYFSFTNNIYSNTSGNLSSLEESNTRIMDQINTLSYDQK